MDVWHHRALDSFKKGQYTQSIKFFSKALDLVGGSGGGSSESITLLLDQRAACYEKLNRLQDALNDAKKMVKIDKTNPKSYLRLGRVLKLLGYDKSSFKVYEKGLEHVDKRHKLYNNLSKLARSNQPVNAKGIDPILALPFELTHFIFGQFTLRQLLTCMEVSKGWNQYIRSDTLLWNDIDFASNLRRGYVSKKLMARYLKLCKNFPLRALRVKRIKKEEEYQCLEMIQRVGVIDLQIETYSGIFAQLQFSKFAHIKKLEFCGCSGLVSILDVLMIPGLEELYWVDVECQNRMITESSTGGGGTTSSVTTFSYKPKDNNRTFLSQYIVEKILATCNAIDCLELRGIGSETSLPAIQNYVDGRRMQKLAISFSGGGNRNSPQIPYLGCKGLSVLAFENGSLGGDLTASGGDDFSGVHTLNLSLLDSPNFKSVLKFVKKHQLFNVEQLVLDSSSFDVFDKNDLMQLALEMPRLQCISLQAIYKVNDDLLDGLKHFEHLKTVNLMATMVTGQGVVSMIRNGHGKIRNLCIGHCSSISAATYQWLRNNQHIELF